MLYQIELHLDRSRRQDLNLQPPAPYANTHHSVPLHCFYHSGQKSASL